MISPSPSQKKNRKVFRSTLLRAFGKSQKNRKSDFISTICCGKAQQEETATNVGTVVRPSHSPPMILRTTRYPSLKMEYRPGSMYGSVLRVPFTLTFIRCSREILSFPSRTVMVRSQLKAIESRASFVMRISKLGTPAKVSLPTPYWQSLASRYLQLPWKLKMLPSKVR